MARFGENAATEQEVPIEAGQENVAESPEALTERIQENSEQAITDGEALLNEASGSIKPEEEEGGPGLLEAARDKMRQVGDNIKTLASSTAQKIKFAIVGKNLEEMTDDELAERLNQKREQHTEAVAHSKMTMRDTVTKDEAGEKLGYTDKILVKGSYEARQGLNEERTSAQQEANKRGLEVLTDQQKEDARQERRTINRERAQAFQEEIDSRRAKEGEQEKERINEAVLAEKRKQIAIMEEKTRQEEEAQRRENKRNTPSAPGHNDGRSGNTYTEDWERL
jgi:hypothetical protein